MRIVIDTNVIASAIFFGGKPRKLVEHVFNGAVTAVASPEIIEEYKATVDYLIDKYKGREIGAALTQIATHIEVISVSRKVKVCRDPDDDKFIACAAEGRCLYIVSGDKDLQSIGRYENITVVTVSEFLNQMDSGSTHI